VALFGDGEHAVREVDTGWNGAGIEQGLDVPACSVAGIEDVLAWLRSEVGDRVAGVQRDDGVGGVVVGWRPKVVALFGVYGDWFRHLK